MTILGVRRLLYLGILLAGGVGLMAWGVAYRLPLGGVDGSGVKLTVGRGADGAGEDPYPRPLSQGERGAEQAVVVDLARFESRRWQRPVIDVPVAPVVVAAVPMPVVQLPPNLQLTGVLMGSVPGTGTAFLRVGSGSAEVVRVGEAMKGLPEVVVTAMTRESVTVRYQGQLFSLTLATAANPVFQRAE